LALAPFNRRALLSFLSQGVSNLAEKSTRKKPRDVEVLEISARGFVARRMLITTESAKNKKS